MAHRRKKTTIGSHSREALSGICTFPRSCAVNPTQFCYFIASLTNNIIVLLSGLDGGVWVTAYYTTNSTLPRGKTNFQTIVPNNENMMLICDVGKRRLRNGETILRKVRPFSVPHRNSIIVLPNQRFDSIFNLHFYIPRLS